jgi:tRNA (cmo5U34)-methyltransferase
MTERCREILSQEPTAIPVDVVCADIRDVKVEQASLVVLNFTLQFIPPEQRQVLLDHIYQGLLPGGAVVLSEKLAFEDEREDVFHVNMHLAFKRANGYSDLEISQKRSALEQVLVPDSFEIHQQRLERAGFDRIHRWFQCFNFASLIAVK